MGAFLGRQNARVEEVDYVANNAYKYPPKTGNYFASHFIMGGERFETNQPEAYLFGENSDLNFLGGKPTPFPYPAPQPNEPTRPLRSLMNIRKESLRFIKVQDESEPAPSEEAKPTCQYNIEFTFDADVRCAITIHYFCTEEITPNGVVYTPRDPSMSSETYHYKRGANQQFFQVSHIFDPSKYSEESLGYHDDEVMPVVIHCVAEEGEEPRQSHMLLAVVEKNSDNTFAIKPLKQKLFVDGLCYLLQEIYGIENKNVVQTKSVGDDDIEDSGSECVICMSDTRDTLILPCRHLCLCSGCADSLRYQANNCPICRAPFRALLQIRAVRKALTSIPHLGSGDNQACQDIPPGYESMPLIEALNGPILSAPPVHVQLTVGLPPESPDGSTKSRHLNRLQSGSASSLQVATLDKDETPTDRPLPDVSTSSPKVVVSAVVSAADKISLEPRSESASLNRNDVRRHKKGSRTSSAPEKVRLLSDSYQIVNEVGTGRRRGERTQEVAETRSLLDGALAENPSAAKPVQSGARTSPVSASTPHSLHLCERVDKESKATDTSPGADDSDYYTPEDPVTTILVDQATDTSLDTPQGYEPGEIPEFPPSRPINCCGNNHRCEPDGLILRRKHGSKCFDRCRILSDENLDCVKTIEMTERKPDIILDSERDKCNKLVAHHHHQISPTRPVTTHAETSVSLPGTPASNASNRSSGDSFSSGSSTKLLLPNLSQEIVPE